VFTIGTEVSTQNIATLNANDRNDPQKKGIGFPDPGSGIFACSTPNTPSIQVELTTHAIPSELKSFLFL